MGKAQEKREAAEKAAAKKAEKDAKKAALKEARAAKKALKAQAGLGVPSFSDRFTSCKRVASGNDGFEPPRRSRRPSRRRRSPCRRNPRNRTNMSGPTRPKRRWTMLYEDMRLYPIRWKGGA